MDHYARLLTAARAFPEPVYDMPALTAGLVSLREAAVYVELIAPDLDSQREALLKAAEHFEGLVARIGPNPPAVKEARAEYDEKLVELRDALRIVTPDLVDRTTRSTTSTSTFGLAEWWRCGECGRTIEVLRDAVWGHTCPMGCPGTMERF